MDADDGEQEHQGPVASWTVWKPVPGPVDRETFFAAQARKDHLVGAELLLACRRRLGEGEVSRESPGLLPGSSIELVPAVVWRCARCVAGAVGGHTIVVRRSIPAAGEGNHESQRDGGAPIDSHPTSSTFRARLGPIHVRGSIRTSRLFPPEIESVIQLTK
jgi:hypothetical protein